LVTERKIKNNRKKRILIVIPTLNHGGSGSEKIATLQGDLFSENYEIFYLVLHDSNFVSNSGLVIALGWKYNLITVIKSILFGPLIIRRYCKENNIDIVISHMERSNYIVSLSRIFSAKQYKHFAVVHNAKYVKSIKHFIFVKLLYPKIDKIVCVSKRIENIIRTKFRLQNLITIYNPLDIDNVKNLKKDQIEDEDKYLFSENAEILINIGRLHQQKGHKFLIEAFSIVQKLNPQLKLIILGEGVLRGNIELQIKRLGLNDCVFLLGNKKNVYPYIMKSDLFVFSSLWEGFPGVLIEALACGIPIISSDCDSGPREILSPNLSLSENIDYPYQTESGFIVSDPSKTKTKFVEELSSILIERKGLHNNVKNTNLLKKISKSCILDEWTNILQ
jgi:N-acetylgalactosamine-N,N'-diacetylbacillosaminyl-diphospho-undecaprenol 4-alpha-N-acetylgalactosaminyltransferase